jgi:NADH-quinone oxidoreductase subunit C
MTPDEVGAALVTALGQGEASVSDGDTWARATVDVPAPAWTSALTRARDDLGCDFFDWLSAVDEEDQGYSVVAHVWSTSGRHGALIRTRVPRDAASLDSAVEVYPGAAWHERETHEMFGIDFPGHPHLVPLLLPPEFEGHPLRKDFVLASRVAKAWPGAKEPGESHVEGTARRQPMRPPGVPAPGEWGPAPEGGAPAERPTRERPAARERPVRERPAARERADGPPGERPEQPPGERPERPPRERPERPPREPPVPPSDEPPPAEEA